MTMFDAKAFKQTTHAQWNAVADRWNAWAPLLDRWLGPVTETLLAMAKVGPGSRVLHVASGSGQEAMQTARRVGPSGYVLATDLSEALTALARSNFAAALRVGGYLGAIVYATPEECRFFSDPVGVIRRRAALPPPAPGQPGPFSLGTPGRIEELFAAAGLTDIQVRKVDAPVILDSAAECLRFEQESFGALHQMLGKLDDAAKAAVWAEVGEKLAAFESNGKFKGPCVMIAAVGRRQ